MTGNEVRKIQPHADATTIQLVLAACQEERARIVWAIEREAKAVDAGVSKPDLWALSGLVREML
jgi:hypothetical protein